MARGWGLLQWHGKDKPDPKGKTDSVCRPPWALTLPWRSHRALPLQCGKCSSLYDQGQCVSLSTQGSPLETQLRAGHLGTLCQNPHFQNPYFLEGERKVFRSNCVLCANHPGRVNHPTNGLFGEPGSQTSQGPTLEAGLSEDSSLWAFYVSSFQHRYE